MLTLQELKEITEIPKKSKLLTAKNFAIKKCVEYTIQTEPTKV